MSLVVPRPSAAVASSRRSIRSARLASSAIACAGIAASFAPSARASLTGFSDFAPINESVEGVPSPVPGGLTLNGYSADRSQFQVTASGVTGQGVSGFAATPQPITSFQAKFTYVGTFAGTPADGFTFAVHNDPRGTAALGGGGGSLGYTANANAAAITPSAATAGILYFPYNGNVVDVSADYKNGANATGFVYFPGDVDLHSQTPIDVTVSYYGNSLTTTYRQQSTGRVYSRTLGGVDLPGAFGASTGYVGFTGGTGGFTATQTISNFSFNNAAGAFAPISLSGFNHDLIVETGATDTLGAITATLDGGTNKTGATFYQQGYNAGFPTTGVPTNVPFTSANDTAHSFAVKGAAENNGVLLNASSTTGTLTLDAPAAYSALSFLTTTGNGSGGFDATIHFADGSTETITGIASPDWFFNGGAALIIGGRIDGVGTIDSAGSDQPRLYQSDVFLSNTTGLIQSIDLTLSAGTGNTVVFGVSGVASAVPEPAAAGVIAAAALALLNRRRRRVA